MSCTTFITETRELDARAPEGLEVRLLWHPATDTVTVAVLDTMRRRAFDVVVDGEDALDAFHHPFAYAASRGVLHEDQPIAADVRPSFSEA